MSETSQGAGWWLASDGKWHPPELPPAPPPPPVASTASGALVAKNKLWVGRKRWLILGSSLAVVVVIVAVVAVLVTGGGHSADWNKGYRFGLGSDIIPGAAPTESGSGHNISVAFEPSPKICTGSEVAYVGDLNGVGGASLPETRLAASEPHPGSDFLAGCVAGVERVNASFLERHGLSTSCGDWGNAAGLLPGC